MIPQTSCNYSGIRRQASFPVLLPCAGCKTKRRYQFPGRVSAKSGARKARPFPERAGAKSRPVAPNRQLREAASPKSHAGHPAPHHVGLGSEPRKKSSPRPAKLAAPDPRRRFTTTSLARIPICCSTSSTPSASPRNSTTRTSGGFLEKFWKRPAIERAEAFPNLPANERRNSIRNNCCLPSARFLRSIFPANEKFI